MRCNSHLHAVALAAALSALLGCNSTPTATVDTVQAAFKGVVTASGLPVANATVTLTVTQVLQNGNSLPVEITRHSGLDGSFAGQLQTGGPGFQSMLTIELVPPPGSSLQPKSINGGMVSLTEVVPPDTITVSPAFD
jgi:hypothetical protein